MISRYDDWINDRVESTAMWIAYLSNNEVLYEDEGRYEDSAFKRLKQYCENNNVFITKLVLRFRSHYELAYENIGEGFFFRKSILGSFFSHRNEHYYNIGYVKDNVIFCKKWHVPELIVKSEETRDIIDHEDSIIWNIKID